MNFGTTPVSLPSILSKIEAAAKTGVAAAITDFGADLIFLSSANEEYHLGCPPGDQFLVLFPQSFPVWEGVVLGAGSSYTLSPGAENLGFNLALKSVVFTRLNMDQEFRSSELFTNTTLGIMALANAVIRTFQIWTAPVTGDATKSYLREPARITVGPQISHRDYRKGLWSLLSMTHEMKFTLSMTL